MTIEEFLLARIAEDEERAEPGRAAWGEHDRHLDRDDFGRLLADPARIRAECAAKRRIVAFYEEDLGRARAYRNPRWTDAMNDSDRVEHRLQEARTGSSYNDCRALAQIYADHPDFDPAWGTTQV